MKIITIDERFPFLDEVIRLADENSSTLGFLPREAFVNQTKDQKIFVAIDDSENVLGYLLYGVNQRESLVYITHLCVDRTYRGKGIARKLFNRLVESTKNKFLAIRVRCRRDYEASKVWPKLGFHVKGEIPGRSEEGSILTVWWFDFGYPTLFSYAVSQRTLSKLAVVIDANIFFDLFEQPNEDNQSSHSLLSDWLDIELCLTNETRTEINRQNDSKRRNLTWTFANQFSEVNGPDDLTKRILIDLHNLFPKEMSESDESDYRQIAKSIAADIQFFITNDVELLRKSDQVYERFGMRIIQPTELIIHQDALIRGAEYQPARLAGSNIQRKRVSLNQSRFLEHMFQSVRVSTHRVAKTRQSLVRFSAYGARRPGRTD
jgi:predicted GNAT family acetyltransferase/predicted nucleic acid-binding protein